eukprot:3074457-Amphidinium_carterae.1
MMRQFYRPEFQQNAEFVMQGTELNRHAAAINQGTMLAENGHHSGKNPLKFMFERTNVWT